MSLHFLEFDYSEDAEGWGAFDAMASVREAAWPTLQAEAAAVLAWAHGAWGGRRSLDEGGDWDCQLDAAQEWNVPWDVDYDDSRAALVCRAGEAGPPRFTLTLTLSGSPAFCAALRDRFGLEG